MRWFTLALAAMTLVGCGSRSASGPALVVKREPGPSVDVSVEPLRVGGDAPKPETSRPQTMSPNRGFAEPVTPRVQEGSTNDDDVSSRRRDDERVSSRRSDDDEPKPRRRRKRIRRPFQEDAPGDTQIEKSDSQPRKERKTKEKKFEELSAEERRRLIEGG
jgi:hypothetical protein